MITRRRFLAGSGVILTAPSLIRECAAAVADQTRSRAANTTRVQFQILDAQTGRPTSAMACIVDAASGEVRLPPDGRIMTRPSVQRSGKCERMSTPALNSMWMSGFGI
jgi:hypothetical protein